MCDGEREEGRKGGREECVREECVMGSSAHFLCISCWLATSSASCELSVSF